MFAIVQADSAFPVEDEQMKLLGEAKQSIKRNAYSMRKAMVRELCLFRSSHCHVQLTVSSLAGG
jgi:hypothetical protein